MIKLKEIIWKKENRNKDSRIIRCFRTGQKEEVVDLKYMTLEEMENAYINNDEIYTFSNWLDFNEVIEYLKNKRKEMII